MRNPALLAFALCFFTVTAHSAVAGNAHPVVQVLMSNLALREAVRRDLPHAAEIAAHLSEGASVKPEQAALLTLVAHRAEIPSWQVSEVLGPESAKRLQAVAFDEDTMELLKSNLPPDDIAEKLAAAYDNDRAEWSPKTGRAAVMATPVKLPAGGKLIIPDAPATTVHHPSTLAPATPFLSRGRFHPKEGEGLPDAILEKGTVKDLPAVRLTFPDGRVYVAVNTGLAKTWEEARSAAQALGRGWDLPTTEDYFPLIASTALDVRIAAGRTEWPDAPADEAIHPLWSRFADEADNARFKGAARLYTMRDGHGFDDEYVDIGPNDLKQAREALREIQRMLLAGEHRMPKEEEMIAAALKAHKAKTGAMLNPRIAHPELPPDVNAMIAKPSKEDLEQRARIMREALEAFSNGWPVYAVQRWDKR